MTHLFNCLFVLLNRKFADLEAANHRLASALYLKDEEKNASSLSPEDRDAAYRSDGSTLDASRPAEGVASACSDALFHPRDGNSGRERQTGPGNLWTGRPGPQSVSRTDESQAGQQQADKTGKLAGIPSSSCGTSHQPSAQGHCPSRPPETASDSQTAQPDSASIPSTQDLDASPAGSPGLDPLSPEPCDLSDLHWTFSDTPACTRGQKSIVDISESQWSEMVELLSVGGPDGAMAEVEAYFESICACRGEEEMAEFGFADFFDSCTENAGEAASEGGDGCEYVDEDGRDCQGAAQRQNQGGVSAARVAVEQQLPAALGYRSDGSELQACQHPQGRGPCALGSRIHFTPFEGVAQSFTVPPDDGRPRASPTLPREEDWPFTDILEDRASTYG